MRLEEGHQKGNKDERTRVESAGQRQGKNTRDNGYLKLEKSMFIPLGCRLPRWHLRCMIALASLWQWRNHWFVLFSQGVKMGWEIKKDPLPGGLCTQSAGAWHSGTSSTQARLTPYKIIMTHLEYCAQSQRGLQEEHSRFGDGAEKAHQDVTWFRGN